MSFRVVVISKSAKLDLKINHLVIRDLETVKIHLSEIAVLMIESTAVSLTAALLCELAKQKIKVIFCDEKRNPISELLPYYGSHDTSLKIHLQIQWEESVKQWVWTEIVRQKIDQQRQVLQDLQKEESQKLQQYLQELEYNDQTNREGHAAKVYFNALFGKSFTRGQDNLVNAALNYGYSILLSAFNREIVAAGYCTQLGLFHNNMFNQFNLSCDLMEPFRPVIDRYVCQMELVQFEKGEKMQLVNLLNCEVLIDGKKQYLLNAIKIYLKSVFDVLGQQPNSFLKEYRNEL